MLVINLPLSRRLKAESLSIPSWPRTTTRPRPYVRAMTNEDGCELSSSPPTMVTQLDCTPKTAPGDPCVIAPRPKANGSKTSARNCEIGVKPSSKRIARVNTTKSFGWEQPNRARRPANEWSLVVLEFIIQPATDRQGQRVRGGRTWSGRTQRCVWVRARCRRPRWRASVPNGGGRQRAGVSPRR